MNADTVDQIEDVEPALEENVRLVFEALDLIALTRLNQPAEFQQATPHVEIKCRLNGQTGRRELCPDGVVRYSAWSFALALQAVTRPQSGDDNNRQHSLYRARIRAVCSTLAQNSQADLVKFPFHIIAEPLRESPTDSALRAKEGIEYSTLLFTGIVMVRPGTWPLN